MIIVSGPPCSGKTTLARHLADRLNLPFIYKDGIKERLFDRLGTGGLEWSSLLSLASYDLLYYFIESQLKAGASLVVEANFRPERETRRFLELNERYAFLPFQIQCHTEGQVLLERFRRRAASGERHPGHLDHLNEPNLLEILQAGRHAPLDIGGQIFEIDTTDFDAIDYEGLLAAIADLADRA
jgi:predicted kinase